MAGSWAFETNTVTPASAGTVLDYVETPPSDNAQPYTISFDRQRPINGSDNSALRAQITYRTEGTTRTVVCDWRGQASLTANQVSVKGISFAPKLEAYAQSAGAHRYGVMVGFGALAKSSVLLTDDPIAVAVGPGTPDPAEIIVPKMATRLVLRASLVEAGPTYGGEILDELIGAATLSLVHGGGGYVYHVEPLQLAHFQQGIELGEADQVLIQVPSGLTGEAVLIVPVFELAL